MKDGAEPLRIAIVCSSLSRLGGGILPIMQGHAVQLATAGVAVTAHGVEDGQAALDAAGWGPVPRALSPPRVASFRYAPGLARTLHEARPDIVHQHALWQYPSLVVSSWRRQTGRPVVISTQGMLEPWAVRNAGLKKRIAGMLFERGNLRNAACIHCSKSELDGVRAYGLKNPVAVVPNGVKLPNRSQPPPGDLRTLLFLGRIDAKKGIEELLRAWALLGPSADGWLLQVTGWGEPAYVVAMQDLANELGLDRRVAFTGPLFGDEKAEAFRSAAGFVLPSFSEGLPMAVLEAWSYALPVLMTRECNLPEGFAAGAALRVVSEPARLADTLGAFLGLPAGERRAMGDAGRRLVEERFTWDRITAEMHQVYTWVLGGGPPPACVVTD